MGVPNIQFTKHTALTRFAVLILAAGLVVSACGASSDAEEPPPSNVGLSVSSGSFTTTVRAEGITTVPFSETVVVEAEFENPIYGSAGQTSVFAEASPSDYRIGARPNRNGLTFSFSLANRHPGTVEVSIYEKRGAAPLVFTLQIGE